MGRMKLLQPRFSIGTAVFYLVTLVVPTVLWLLQRNPATLFTDSYSTMSTLAQFLGIVGLSFFSGNLILSGRYHLLDKWFQGLDRVYLFHQFNGRVTLYFLTTHALLITFRLGLPFSRWLGGGINLVDGAVNYGRIALLGLMSLVIFTIYIKTEYEMKKKIHRFMGVFLFLGGVHAFLIPSDIAFNVPLRFWVLGLVSIAVVSYLIRSVFGRYLVPRYTYVVAAVNKLGSNVTEVILNPQSQAVQFAPGQFMFIRFSQTGFRTEEHPFTISTSNKEGKLRLSAKASGDFTEELGSLKVGTPAYVQGAYGGFSFTKTKNRHQVWVAGGIGITPFMSMVRSLRDDSETFKRMQIDLFYSVTNETEAVFLDELKSYRSDNFRLYLWETTEQGRLTVKDISTEVVNVKDREIFICGPEPMIIAMSDQFKKEGVPETNIHFELFRLF